MLHNGKNVDPVVVENVLMRFSAWKDNVVVRYGVIFLIIMRIIIITIIIASLFVEFTSSIRYS